MKSTLGKWLIVSGLIFGLVDVQFLYADDTVYTIDTDGDGVPDYIDLDDDNDGILDVDEGLQKVIINNSGFEDPVIPTGQGYHIYNEDDVPYWYTTATDDNIELWESGYENIESDTGEQHAELNAYQNASLYQDFNTTPGTVILWYVAHRGRDSDTTADVAKVEAGPVGGALADLQEMSDTNTAWGHYSGVYIVPADQNVTRFAFEAISTASGDTTRGNFLDSFVMYVARDTDGDGIPDHLDLDSDNDGISDLVESGQDSSLDSDNNGVLDDSNDNDGDGVVSSADANDDDNNSGGKVSPVDKDNDGLNDLIDLDSDGDGIPDVVEAQLTGIYTGNDGNVSDDTNTQGIPSYGLIVPQDTDNDGFADYIDDDSDGDGVKDGTESGLSLSGSDDDGDGIDDAIHASYSDPDGDINDPSTDLQNSDNNKLDVDYRSVILPDLDGDGVADIYDLDDDNDGITDREEGCTVQGLSDEYYFGTTRFVLSQDKLVEYVDSDNGDTSNNNHGIGDTALYQDVGVYNGEHFDMLITVESIERNETGDIEFDVDISGVTAGGYYYPIVLRDIDDKNDGSDLAAKFSVKIYKTGTKIPLKIEAGITFKDIDDYSVDLTDEQNDGHRNTEGVEFDLKYLYAYSFENETNLTAVESNISWFGDSGEFLQITSTAKGDGGDKELWAHVELGYTDSFEFSVLKRYADTGYILDSDDLDDPNRVIVSSSSCPDTDGDGKMLGTLTVTMMA